jgi:hypothetical protein
MFMPNSVIYMCSGEQRERESGEGEYRYGGAGERWFGGAEVRGSGGTGERGNRGTGVRGNGGAMISGGLQKPGSWETRGLGNMGIRELEVRIKILFPSDGRLV